MSDLQEGEIVKVISTELEMKAGAGHEYKKVGTILQGQEVEVLQVNGEFVEVMIEPFWLPKAWLRK